MNDLVDYALYAFIVLCGLALAVVCSLGIMDWLSTAEGIVTNKYYDDPDWVCAKVCTRQDECWTLVIGSEPVWNETTCVDESTYDSIAVGDYFKE